jgi:hypothetical protein
VKGIPYKYVELDSPGFAQIPKNVGVTQFPLVECPDGLVTVLRRSLISLCHLCFERQRADATQICVTATGVVEPVDVLEDRGLCLSSC